MQIVICRISGSLTFESWKVKIREGFRGKRSSKWANEAELDCEKDIDEGWRWTWLFGCWAIGTYVSEALQPSFNTAAWPLSRRPSNLTPELNAGFHMCRLRTAWLAICSSDNSHRRGRSNGTGLARSTSAWTSRRFALDPRLPEYFCCATLSQVMAERYKRFALTQFWEGSHNWVKANHVVKANRDFFSSW